MKAMDAELARSRETVANRSPPMHPEAMDKGKGAARDTDIEASMDAELDALLEDDEGVEERSQNWKIVHSRSMATRRRRRRPALRDSSFPAAVMVAQELRQS